VKHWGQYHPLELIQAGPLVNVWLVPHPKLTLPGVDPTKKIGPFLMMVDTGAQQTSLDNQILQQLGIPPVRMANLIGVSGKADQCPVYLAGILIGLANKPPTNSGTQKPIDVIEATFGNEIIGMPTPPASCKHRGLLGRDFLGYFDLNYHGKTGAFEIVKSSDDQNTAATKPPGKVVASNRGKQKSAAKRKADRKLGRH
jgi:hypothetical protein